MGETPPPEKLRFWPLLGMVLAVDVALVLCYTLLWPGLSGRALSDTLCSSALLLAVASVIPVALDAGRGFSMMVEMQPGADARREALALERRRREHGMVISFALGVATLVIAVLSLLVDLWLM